MRRTIIEKVNNHNSKNKKNIHEWIKNNISIIKNDNESQYFNHEFFIDIDNKFIKINNNPM